MDEWVVAAQNHVFIDIVVRDSVTAMDCGHVMTQIKKMCWQSKHC